MWLFILCQELDTNIRAVPVALAPHSYAKYNLIYIYPCVVGQFQGVAQLFGYFFHGNRNELIFQKNWLGYILADFFTN
jgi:hypothetical protein